ncbi:hypothetical protein ACWD3K_38195, partial [Streptomyces sp. NPDC002778]
GRITPISPAISRSSCPPKPNQASTFGKRMASEACQAFLTQFQAEPTPQQWATWLRDTHGIATRTGDPIPEDQVQPLLQDLQAHYALDPQQPPATEEPEPVGQWYDYFHAGWRTDQQQHGTYPDPAAPADHVHEQDSTTAHGSRPITGEDLAACAVRFQEHERGSRQPALNETAAAPGERAAAEPPPHGEGKAAPAGVSAQAAEQQHTQRVDAAIDEVPPDRPTGLTTVDRYYLAWMEYRTQNAGGAQSSTREAEELSSHLASKGLRGRGNKPLSPATLRRYLLPFRIYNIWAKQRKHSNVVSLDAVAKECATQGITAQYNKPLNADYLTDQSTDFERRWQALHHHHASTP